MLISDEYRKQNEIAHKEESWGTTGHKFAYLVHELYEATKSESMLDYGAGKQTLQKVLEENFPTMIVFSYDPCRKEISKTPGRHDLVTCTDVFEHIEEEYVDNVLDDIKRVMKKAGFFVVSTVPAIKKLPDGRNAHITVKPLEWWLPKIWERFNIGEFQNFGSEFHVIVSKK